MITRIVCKILGHKPEDWDVPDYRFTSMGQQSPVALYTCIRCERKFWQGPFGIQIADNDPRLVK